MNVLMVISFILYPLVSVTSIGFGRGGWNGAGKVGVLFRSLRFLSRRGMIFLLFRFPFVFFDGMKYAP